MGRAVESFILMLIRLGLGGLFAFAGYAKLQDPQKFAFAVKAFKILPPHLTQLMSFVVPWMELVCGALLVIGWRTRSAALVLWLQLLAFILATASVLYRGLDVTCSCFGDYELLCHGPLGVCHLARNAVFVLAAVYLLARGPGFASVDALAAGRGTAKT